MQVKLDDLAKTSFLKCTQIDERTIPLQSCFNDDGEWEMWFPSSSGLVRVQGDGPVEGPYFAKKAVKNGDGFLEFINWILKRAYFNEIVGLENSILEDIQNLGASIDKIDFFHRCWLKDKSQIESRYVATEIEYIFKVCRSIFDLLQEISQIIWRRFKYLDDEAAKKELKKSFADIVLCRGVIRTIKELVHRFQIPEQLAQFYYQQSEFFVWLRNYRDKIVHSGKGVDLVVITKKGFAIATDKEPFSSLSIWNDKNTQPNNLGSVRAVCAYAVLNTIKALEAYAYTIQRLMKFPEDIAPNHKIFIRGPHISRLIESNRYIDEHAWV